MLLLLAPKKHLTRLWHFSLQTTFAKLDLFARFIFQGCAYETETSVSSVWCYNHLSVNTYECCSCRSHIFSSTHIQQSILNLFFPSRFTVLAFLLPNSKILLLEALLMKYLSGHLDFSVLNKQKKF